MLRLKQALEECGIKQKALCEVTGFGKTQISLTLSTGKLPANAEKFLAGVTELVAADNRLTDWLADRGSLSVHSLCDILPDPGQDESVLPLPAPATLPRILCDIAGRAALENFDDPQAEMIMRLARTISYLHRKMGAMAGHDAPWTIQTETRAAEILKGAS